MGEVVRRMLERNDEHNLTNLTLRVFTMRYYTSVVSLMQIDRRL
jgi:hypothetical protein